MKLLKRSFAMMITRLSEQASDSRAYWKIPVQIGRRGMGLYPFQNTQNGRPQTGL
jgi:predicted lipoprotein with Yx(FWY)xxD motif